MKTNKKKYIGHQKLELSNNPMKNQWTPRIS